MKTPIQTELERKQLQFYQLANGLMGLFYLGALVWGIVEFIKWIV